MTYFATLLLLVQVPSPLQREAADQMQEIEQLRIEILRLRDENARLRKRLGMPPAIERPKALPSRPMPTPRITPGYGPKKNRKA